MGKKRAVLFGTGKIFRIFMDICDSDKVEILAVCDNNDKVQGKVLGIKICKPDEIFRLDYDFVIITSSYFEEIQKQLMQLGVNESKIINFYEIYQKLSVYRDIARVFCKDEILFFMLAQKKYESKMQTILDIQEKSLFMNAKNYINSVCYKQINSLEEVEFQVFSQFGEDGIIQWLIHNVELNNKIFVEFGVENYMESNTRFLLMNNNWKGLIIDGSKENINQVRNWKDFWKYDLTAVDEFITKDNINDIILKSGFEGDIGLLSIDIDGNDYWVLNSIECISPRILICEYNSIFGADKKVSVPYDENFIRTEKHYSNLYWGGSIRTFCDWAEENDYYYAGSNSAGNDAFFIRKDCISINKLPRKNYYIESKFRQSRDKNGRLNYLCGLEQLNAIREMELVDLENNRIDTIAKIYNLE